VAYSKVALTNYLWIPRAELKSVESAKRMLTVRSKWEDRTEVELFDDSNKKWFGVPRYFYRDPKLVADEVLDHQIDGKPAEIGFRSEFWPGQEKVIAQFSLMRQRGRTGFILEAPPGFGKTVCLIKMMSILGTTVLVVVPRSNLTHQWHDRLMNHSNLKLKDIGFVMDGSVDADWKHRKVMIGLVHTLALDRFGPEFKKHFGCVIFDEVDRSVPPQTFSTVAAMFPAKFRIGASATLKRGDGLEAVFEKHIGQTLIHGKGGKRMRAKVLMVMWPEDSGFVYPSSKKMNRRGMLISRLANSPGRNLMLCRWIKMMYNSDRKILVLADRTKQLMLLRDMLEARQGIPRSETGLYVSRIPTKKKRDRAGKMKQTYRKVSQGERDRVASACKVILATYGMISLGTDIPELAGLLYATPQSSVEQSKGRIERFVEGKKQPIVVDIVDTFYRDTLNWASSRRKHYKGKGLDIRVVR